MTRTRTLVLASGAFCLFSILIFGCTEPQDTSDVGLFPARAKGSGEAALTELEYSGVGDIEGVVTFDGETPGRTDIAAIFAHADKNECLKGDVKDQTWMVDTASKAVANVVVWVQPPRGTYFKKPDDSLKAWQDEVTVDQPFCAFEPHVVVLYPQHYEGGQLTPTGQVLKVLNSAAIGHNIKVAGSSDKNPARGATLSAKNGVYVYDSVRVDNRELSMNCDIHKWMTGYALTFDHPYAAVTNKEGKFVIKNVPAGVTLTFRGWHEALKRFDPAVAGGTSITVEAGKTKTLNFQIKGK